MRLSFILLASAGIFACSAHAQGTISAKQTEVLNQLVATYAAKAKEEAKERGKTNVRGTISDKPFAADVGREFYLKRHTWQSTDYTCSGCHTEDPKKEGKHIDTGKPIKPLAPIANAERFTDARKVEKNFSDHCHDFHERDCTAFEKGNFVTYMMSVK